jgi:hypothetical protein
MGLLDRLRGERKGGDEIAVASLRGDARAMRTTLGALHAERAAAGPAGGEPDLRAIVRDLLEGEVVAPTADVSFLVARDTDPNEFYAHEIEPNWDGLDENARAAKIDGFVEIAAMADASPEALPRDMVATVRTKALTLAWAFDEVHGYLGRLARGGSA